MTVHELSQLVLDWIKPLQLRVWPRRPVYAPRIKRHRATRVQWRTLAHRCRAITPTTSIASSYTQLSKFEASYRPSYAPRPTNVVDRSAVHQIWGHPGRKAVDQLESNLTGVQLTGDHMDCQCQIGIKARMTHIISRRPAESRARRPFYRIPIDLTYIVPVVEECLDGSKYG
jgi:hypothetical protein